MNSSMQLTREADYGVRVMIALATARGGRRSVLYELAKDTGSPESFLSKVLQKLVRVGLVASLRGPAGGFEISKLGLRASMRTVIEAIDGPMLLNTCLADVEICARSLRCPAHPVWAEAQKAILQVLDSAKIVDLAASYAPQSASPRVSLSTIRTAAFQVARRQ